MNKKMDMEYQGILRLRFSILEHQLRVITQRDCFIWRHRYTMVWVLWKIATPLLNIIKK